MALTPDNLRYYMKDSSDTRTRTFLWSNSRLVLSSGFSWTTTAAPTLLTGSLLPGVSIALNSGTTYGTYQIKTLLPSDTGYVPSGVSKSVLKVLSADGTQTLYIPLTQVCVVEKDSARVLNHNFEQVTPDSLEGAGYYGAQSTAQTFSMVYGSLPSGLLFSADGSALQGSLTEATLNSVVIKNVHKSTWTSDATPVYFTRNHYRRMGFYNTSKFEIASANNDGILPTKLIFSYETNVTVPSAGDTVSYGHDSTTNPDGSLNFISIKGGSAPYTVSIDSITAKDKNGSALNVSTVLQAGTVNGVSQWHLGFTETPTKTPEATLATDGSTWQYTINSNRIYVRSFSNGGYFKIESDSCPATLYLTLRVVDSTGVVALDPDTGVVPVFTIPVVAAPSVPQVINAQDVVLTGDTYNITLGNPSSDTPELLTGYPYSDTYAESFFRTDMSWWSPSLTTTTYGYNLTLVCNRSLPQGGPYQPVLFERFPTIVNSGNAHYYDYVEVQRKLRSFVVSGGLSLSYPADPVTYVVNSPVDLLYQVFGGTSPYTWVIGSYDMPGISGSTLNSGTQYALSGSYVPQTTDVFPKTLEIPITVVDSSSPYQLTKTHILTITFTTQDNLPLVKNPYLQSNFKFFAATNTSKFLTSRSTFPWSNLDNTSYDYVNDYADGSLPGGLLSQTGSSSGTPYEYTMEVVNSSPSVWASFRYKMPMGLCFALSKLTTGGYSTTGYYQIINPNSLTAPAASETIGLYTTSGFSPLASAQIKKDSNGNAIGFTLGVSEELYLKYGDVVLSAVNRLGSPTDQYWELGYMAPHFELMDTLNAQAPRDTPGSLTVASGDQLSAALGISSVVYSGAAPQTNYTNFLTPLTTGVYDTAAYNTSPLIGTASDTLEISLTKTGYSSSTTTLAMPISEDSATKVWVASADKWGNPSYYWLGNSSVFKTTIDNYSKTLYFGFTECDRILKVGQFPTRDSALFPEVYYSLVNFYLVNSDGTAHSRNTELHSDKSFITSLRSFVTVPTTQLTDSNGYMGAAFNTYLNNPASDPSTYAYFMGPTSSGFDELPNNVSGFSHTTITNIDRGFRVACALDSLGLWTYLNAALGTAETALESGTYLHMVWMFLPVRPNIAIGTYKDLLDMTMLTGASGLSSTELSSKYLRGKAYARVPIHMIIGNGASPTSAPPLIPSGASVKIYGS